MLCGGYKAKPTGPLIAAAVGFGLSMEAAAPLPARVHTVPRRSSLQHEYDAAHIWTANMADSTIAITFPASQSIMASSY